MNKNAKILLDHVSTLNFHTPPLDIQYRFGAKSRDLVYKKDVTISSPRRKLALLLDIVPEAIYRWKHIPELQCFKLEKLTPFDFDFLSKARFK